MQVFNKPAISGPRTLRSETQKKTQFKDTAYNSIQIRVLIDIFYFFNL